MRRNIRLLKENINQKKNLKYNNVNFTVYFCDWLLYCRQRGFTHNCYFDYELYNKEPEIRDTFLNEGYRKRVQKACNKKEYRKIFLDKALFNDTFKKYVKRDWLDVSCCSFDEFNTFIKKHEEFFAKSVRGTGGAGARVIKTNDDTTQNLFELCKEEGLIIEEIIKQNSEIAKFNESTLNTVRVYTLVCADNTAKVMGAVARFGRAGNVIDNFHGGGVAATIDVESGKVNQAINRAHIRTDIHPDSKEKILGFKYPYWDKLKEAVCDAALKVPEMRHIGWDVCITENGDVEFVEGNGKPNFDVLQSPDQIGKKHIYEDKIREIENIEGINPIVYDKIMINTKNMEIGFIRMLPRRLKRKIKRIISR
ncbi:sugar-transfer associated ATP-grasp domain-containing protein [Anaerofustis sp. LCP19S3_F7]|uniref:sugar-transfer associated ATP-grasp domain-containing protein n=1 Tax=Anaerofustis sp. LCP19S3_F7 TaxID=3440247 RepID=UPI003F93E66F